MNPIFGRTSAQNSRAQFALSQAGGAESAPLVGQVGPIIAPTPAQGLQALSYVTISLPDNAPLTFSLTGDYFFIDTITNVIGPVSSVTGLSAQADSINTVVQLRYPKQGTRWPRAFNSLKFTNLSGQALTIKAWVGFGEIVTQWEPEGAFGVGQQLRLGSINFSCASVAAPYAVNDIVNSAAANKLPITGVFNVPSNIASGVITGAQIMKSGASIVNTSFRLFLFQTTSVLPPTYDDHTPFVMVFGARIVAVIDFPAFVTGGAGSTSAICNISDVNIPYVGGDDLVVYGVLVALAPFAPAAAQQFTISLYGNSSAYSSP